MVVRIENWSVVMTGDEYTPPELQRPCLKGEVYDSPKFEDGHRIRTTEITKAEGRLITTESGTVYLLGAVKPDYEKWVKESTGKDIDPENPVRFIQGQS